MFSVYGVAGRLFSGPLDQLRQVAGVKSLARARAIGAQVQEPFAPLVDDALGRDAAPNPTPPPAGQQSVAAYTQAQARNGQRHPLTQVHEVMSRRRVTISTDTVALDAWQAMADQGVAQAPVVDAQGRLVGLLLRSDLLRPELLPGPNAHPLAWRAWLAQAVQEVMWSPVPSVLGDADIRHVASVLLETGLPGIPVVDAGGVVTGFVSRSDLLRAIIHDPPLDLWS